MLAAFSSQAAVAQKADAKPADPPKIRVSDKPPPGFEALEDQVTTIFDIEFNGQRIGTTSATITGDTIRFTDPEGLARLFPDATLRDKVVALFSKALPQNQQYRCLPGRTSDCGQLPLGESGVIVNPEFFRVTVFLGPEYYAEAPVGPVYLPDPISAPSLIQTAQLSFSTGRNAISDVRLGAVLDTIGSVGRTSLVAQTLLRDSSANLQRAYVQHYWDRRRAAGGVLQDEQSVTLRSYRALGAEFGSFFGSRLDAQEGQSTPIRVVLPQPAIVEIYRDDVLIQSRQLEAGLQDIDTASLPAGSYPVRIVARVGSMVVLDEIRSFTRVAGLTPKGEIGFLLRAGARIEDRFSDGLTPASDNEPFFPVVTNEPVAAALVSRRIGEATGVSAQALLVDDTVYGELSVATYRNNITGILAVSGGSDGSYAAQLNAAVRLKWVDFSLTGRHAHVSDDAKIGPVLDRYTPYYRSEDLVTANASFQVLDGSLSLTGSYSRSPGFKDRYSYGFRYSRALDIGRIGSARITLFGLAIDDDKRVGISVSLFRRLDRKTLLFATAGGEYRDAGNLSGQSSGVFPVAELRASRNDSLGSVDLLSQAGVSTDADRSRAFVSENVTSNYGLADVTVDYEDRRGSSGQDGVAVTGNAFTGFVVSGGKFSLGVRQPGGDAAVLVGIDRSGIPEKFRDRFAQDGRYNVVIGNRKVAEFEAGKDSVIMLPSFREYSVALQPEQAPPYIINLTSRHVALYPGNVARLEYGAQLGITVFGRLVGTDGAPIANARVSAGSDVTTTDDKGYFLVSGPLDAQLEFAPAGGEACAVRSMRQLFEHADVKGTGGYLRIGDLLCSGDGARK